MSKYNYLSTDNISNDVKSLYKYYSQYFKEVERPHTNYKSISDFQFRFFPYTFFNKFKHSGINLQKMRNKSWNLEDTLFFNYYKIKYDKYYDFYKLQLFINKFILYSDDRIHPIKKNIILSLNLGGRIFTNHRNIAFYDIESKIITIYEPHGCGSKDESYISNIKKLLNDWCIKNLILLNNIEFNCPICGLQTKEVYKREISIKTGISDLKGYCVFWSFLMVEMKLNNPTKNIIEIETNFQLFLKEYNIDISNYIRSYFLYINYLIYLVCKLVITEIQYSTWCFSINDYFDNIILLKCAIYNIDCDIINLFKNPIYYLNSHKKDYKLEYCKLELSKEWFKRFYNLSNMSLVKCLDNSIFRKTIFYYTLNDFINKYIKNGKF